MISSSYCDVFIVHKMDVYFTVSDHVIGSSVSVNFLKTNHKKGNTYKLLIQPRLRFH